MTEAVEAVEVESHESEQPATKPKAKDEKPHYHVNEFKTGKKDPFTEAFNQAQDTIHANDEEKPEPAPTKAAAPKAKEPEEKPKKAVEPEDKPKAEKKVEPETDEESEEDTAADTKEEKPASKAEPKPKGPLEPKKWWSNRRREAFKFQPRHVQEAWLTEAPQPDQRWTEEQKATFAKIPVAGQELILEKSQEIERGYGEKFENLAKERKLADEIRKAVPAQLRAAMEERGLTEPQVFQRLAQQQVFALASPREYILKFMADARIDPASLFQQQVGPDGQPLPLQQQAQRQAAYDIRAHPDYQAMQAELQELRAERQKASEFDDERLSTDIQDTLNETDGEGNSLYPFIRVLAAPMADIIEADPERFNALGTKDRISAAYFQALEDYPELQAIHMAAPQPAAVEVDEPKPAPKQAEPDDERERVAKLEKAVTPKSTTPASAPASVKSGDPFEKAWASALKTLGKR